MWRESSVYCCRCVPGAGGQRRTLQWSQLRRTPEHDTPSRQWTVANNEYNWATVNYSDQCHDILWSRNGRADWWTIRRPVWTHKRAGLRVIGRLGSRLRIQNRPSVADLAKTWKIGIGKNCYKTHSIQIDKLSDPRRDGNTFFRTLPPARHLPRDISYIHVAVTWLQLSPACYCWHLKEQKYF